MTHLAKCVVLETDTGSPVTHYYYPRKASLKHEGNKRPDRLTATFGFPNKVREGYEVSYIQDIIDTTYLSGVYPMQLSCFDESGYNQDPTDPAESRFVKVTSGRYKGHYALDFTADGQGVSIPSNKITNIDLSKQFDINIWFTPNTTQLEDGDDEPILWSFRTSDAGMDIGISGTNGNNNSWRGFVRYETTASSLISTMTGSSEKVMTGAPVYIRVKRGSDNVIRLYVNGVEDATASESNSLQPTSTPMVFGDVDTINATSEYKGQIHLIKIYCGSDLTFGQAEKMRMSRPQPQFMKFNGRIRKMTSNQSYKEVQCQSNSYRLTKRTLGSNSTPSAIALTGTFKTILQNAVDEIDSDFTVRALDSFAHIPFSSYNASALGNIYEVGSFLQFADILLNYSKTIMYLTPRKKLIIEQASNVDNQNSLVGYTTDYVFNQNAEIYRYKITNSEDNDAKLVNEVVVTGRSNTDANSSFTPSSQIIRTLRRNVMQLDNDIGLKEYADRIRESLEGNITFDKPPTKYVIQTPTPCHYVRYNHIVKVKRNNGNTTSISGTPSRVIDEYVIVRQVEHIFPQGKTIINVGENDIDYFDDEVDVTRTQSGLVDTTI